MNSYDQDTPHTPANWLAGALVFIVGPIAAAWNAARRLTRPRPTWGPFTPTASDGHGDTHLIASVEDAFNLPLPTPRPDDAARFAAYGQDPRHNARQREAAGHYSALAGPARNERTSR